MHLIASIVVLSFAVLSLLHVYWAYRGLVGASAVLPEVDGRPAFLPSRTASLFVATALAGCAGLVAAASGMVRTPLPGWLLRAAMIALAIVLALRAIGDFRLVGFFKRVRGTRFARLDSALYSPFCLLLAIGIARLACAVAE